MPVTTLDTRAGPFVGNGITTQFPLSSIRVLTAAEINVSLDGTLVSPSLYTVTFALNGNATLVFNTAPTGEVIVDLNPSFKQLINFENQGAFLPESHNEGLDRAAVRDLLLQRDFERSVKAPIGDAGLPLDLPSVADRANRLMAFDGLGRVGQGPLADAVQAAIANAQAALNNQGLASAVVYLQAGLGAVARTVEDKLRRDMPITPFDFGALANGADQAVPLAAMAAVANALYTISAPSVLNVRQYPRLHFPSSDGFVSSQTLTVRAGVQVEMDSALLIQAAANAPIVGLHYIDDKGVDFESPRDVQSSFWIERLTQSDWSSEVDRALLIDAAYVARIRIRRAFRFCRGFDLCMGYGELYLGDIRDNKISDITGRGSPEQFTNHLRVIGGTFACQANPGQSRYGIRVRPGSATGANTMLFDGQSYELGLNIAQTGNPLAEVRAQIVDGTENEISSVRFINQRYEFSGRTHLRVIGQVRSVELGVLDAEREFVNPTSLFVDDQSTGGGGIWAYRHHGVTGPTAKMIWFSGLLKERVLGLTGGLASMTNMECATSVGAAPATQTFSVIGDPPTFDVDGFMNHSSTRWGTRVELNGARSLGISGVKKVGDSITVQVICFAGAVQVTATGTVWTEQSAPAATLGVFGGVFSIGMNLAGAAAQAPSFEGIMHFAPTVTAVFVTVLGPHKKWSLSSFAGQAEPFSASSHLSGQFAATNIPAAITNITYKAGMRAEHIDAASGEPEAWRWNGTTWLPTANMP